MNVWRKLKINKDVIASCEVMAERVETNKGWKYWVNCAKFLEDIRELDYSQISKSQKEWALNIKLELQSEGFQL